MLGNYLYVSDVDRIRDITKVVASDPKVDFVRVYRPDGRIVADSEQGAGYPTGTATSESRRRALQGRETVFRMNEGILEVRAPIVAGKQVLGGVVLGFSQASVEAEIGAIALERIWQSRGLVLAAALVALLITYYVARPIRRLVAATRNVARGQFDFSPQDSWVREISELTESFEKMTHALGTARSELETRVEQRTAELRESERSPMETRNRLRTVVENLPVVTFAVDGDGVFTLSEGKGLEALGRVPSQLVGKSIFDVYHDVPAIAGNIRAALSGEKRSFTVQIGDVVYDARYAQRAGKGARAHRQRAPR